MPDTPVITTETLTLHIDGAREIVLSIVGGCTSPYSGGAISASGESEESVIQQVKVGIERDRQHWEWLGEAAERLRRYGGGT